MSAAPIGSQVWETENKGTPRPCTETQRHCSAPLELCGMKLWRNWVRLWSHFLGLNHQRMATFTSNVGLLLRLGNLPENYWVSQS